MAKVFIRKQKEDKVKILIQPSREGTIDNILVKFFFNEKSLRYDLKIDGQLILSDIRSNACLLIAKEKNVKWKT